MLELRRMDRPTDWTKTSLLFKFVSILASRDFCQPKGMTGIRLLGVYEQFLSRLNGVGEKIDSLPREYDTEISTLGARF